LRTLLVLLLVGLIGGSSACQIVGQGSTRQVGQGLADALERPADADFDSYLATDAEVYLPGPSQISAAAFRNYLLNAQRGHTYFHRASRVYATSGGAGWMLEIIREQAGWADIAEGSPDQAPLWMEVTLKDGRITRAWMHFTLATLATEHQPPELYAATAAAAQLPLPPGWWDGTPALLATAEANDRAEEAGVQPATSDVTVLVAAAAAMALGVGGAAIVLAKRGQAPTADGRGARLLELSSRRQLARKRQHRIMPT
jgi:hypothetical protein